jgi:hypothetical protein
MPLITKQLSPIKGRQELLNKIDILKTSITNKENISSEDMKSLLNLLISILNHKHDVIQDSFVAYGNLGYTSSSSTIETNECISNV